MKREDKLELEHLPSRFKRPSILGFIVGLAFLTFFVMGVNNANITLDRLGNGVLNLGNFLSRAFPPNAGRIEPITMRMLETLEIALVGTVFGVILSIPLALLASRTTCGSKLIRGAVKTFISTVRTIPDLVWALIFVISVGLGTFAGILTITLDTMGFCGRFFSERIDEIDRGPSQALAATGASRFGVIVGSVFPMVFPSMVGTSLFSFERAVRSAVVLGLVGAGGIGVELNVSMELRRFDEAAMIIIVILVVVITLEQISGRIRKRFI